MLQQFLRKFGQRYTELWKLFSGRELRTSSAIIQNQQYLISTPSAPEAFLDAVQGPVTTWPVTLSIADSCNATAPTCCGGKCTDTSTDVVNCGSCSSLGIVNGTTSILLQTLSTVEVARQSVLESSQRVAWGLATTSLPISITAEHVLLTANCGACAFKCTAPQSNCCLGTCSDPSSDPRHCGGCPGSACQAVENCCSGLCVNLASDPSNCGQLPYDGPNLLSRSLRESQ
ncbi:hypothetical protein PEBR_22879 [Penicillium brasilianum]|uniref:Uncharacterized protein n=1 Tax=Penicillium brasilianum TaxID=104259 RepID=A0A1S9RLB0_PENBI|nr:hypothetical protein PEBR_22879 [Penicillium brasilianum]